MEKRRKVTEGRKEREREERKERERGSEGR